MFNVLNMLTRVFLLFATFLAAGSCVSASDAQPLDEESERLSLWHNKWDERRIGFHKSDINESLVRFGDRIIPNFASNESCADPVRVLVPLCGKSLDFAFLAKHSSVEEAVGCEGILQGIREFSEEHPDLNIQQSSNLKDGAFDRFTGNKISILKGDFFQLNSEVTGGKFNAVWDRGAFVAIHPSLREDYVAKIAGLLAPGATILLSTLERRKGTDEALKSGPPFSISFREVRHLYENKEWVESVELLAETNEFERNPAGSERFRKEGITEFFEVVSLIQIK